MHWTHLTDEDQLNRIITKSQDKPQVIFQYSTPCCMTEIAKRSLPNIENLPSVDCYFLDLNIYGNISKKVDELFHLYTNSEFLIIKDGQCLCNQGNCPISLGEIMKHLN